MTDDIWFELQFNPQKALKLYLISLPSFPPDDVQMRFTGLTGRRNLQQAFHFYKYVRSTCRLEQIQDPRILDFGAGWGRISRFFLRDTKPELIWVADCLSDAIHWLRETHNPCNIIKNNALPPIPGLHTRFHLIYAFSIFSHLSPQFTGKWLTYLMDLLHPGGCLVVTTRGRQFINDIELLHRKKRKHSLTEELPPPKELLARYVKGEFQFYPTGGGGELSSDFYGESIIPRRYFDDNYGSSLIAFTEEVPYVDQSVIVLQKK